MRQAVCNKCGRAGWVNDVTVRGEPAGEWCGDCFDRYPHDENKPRRVNNSGSGPNHNDPGFDNVIRALEEDR